MGWIGLWVVFEHAVLAVAAVALGVHLFVLFCEEPTLRRKLGADYEEYCRNVEMLMAASAGAGEAMSSRMM